MGRRLLVLPLLLSMIATLTVGTSVAPAAPAPAPAQAAAAIPPPDDDPFYDPPPGFEATAPGTVLAKREVRVSTYLIPTPVRAFQILVRTTDSTGRPVATVSTVMVPVNAPPPGQRTLLSFQNAIDSLGTKCNPSYQLRTGLQADPTAPAAALLKGWVTMQTDYQGPRMSWIAGKMAGRAVLDGIRAALALPESGLTAESPVLAWGYSGGGHATAWAAQEQPTYAPELSVDGWLANAFTGDLAKTLRGLDGGPFSGFLLAAVIGLSREYDLDVFNERGKLLVERMAEDCVAEIVALNPFKRIRDYTKVDVYTDPRVAEVMAENSAGTVAPRGPVLVQQSRFDEIVSPEFNSGTVDSWCALGADVEYHLSNVPEHVVYGVASVPYALVWMDARLRGAPTNSTCA